MNQVANTVMISVEEYRALHQDAERIDALERLLFECKLNGVIGGGAKLNWHLRGGYRNAVVRFEGQTFRAAIDAAIKGE